MSSISQPRSSRRSSAARTASQHSCVVGCSPWLGLGLGLGLGWSGARSPVPKAMPGCRVSVGSDGETCRGRGVGRVRVRVRARVRGSGLGLRCTGRAVVWRGGCGEARGGAVGAHELQGFAARFAARGGQEVRVPARVRTSRLLKPSRRVRSVNVEIDHHGTDAPLRVAALLEGVSVGSGASAVRRRAPLAAGS